ncbi:DUF4277 domain-containing protein [Streptomyces sp. TRM68367]|uniref:DUF4277 domain-containing protein n=1 Tax=Streptomyces sp. TRM68367 TaxID=2758415 RepID=UPI0029348438|nr:DUF4277 domain-containing protein [Streptomyces sp. TRM68367]
MVEKRLGALPVVAEFLRRLDVAGIVDELCPGGASAHLTHGQVIEALVANRLTSVRRLGHAPHPDQPAQARSDRRARLPA